MHARRVSVWAVFLPVALSCLRVASAHTPSHTNPFACTTLSCGMPQQGAYDQLIVGTVKSLGDADNAKSLFHRMRGTHHWQAVPADPNEFSKYLIPVVIDTGHVVMTVLMAQWEFAKAPLHQGDLVRYSPHNGGVEPPPQDSVAHKYWDIDGCAMVLCRAGDKHCFSYYTPGIYRKRDGVALNARDLKPLRDRPSVDPVTMFRKKTAH